MSDAVLAELGMDEMNARHYKEAIKEAQ